MMDEKPKLARKHSLDMENREKARITGVNDVISFDLENVLLETDYGILPSPKFDLNQENYITYASENIVRCTVPVTVSV